MKICRVTSNEEKQRITRQVLEALPEWFGIPEARENYISESRDQLFFCAYAADKPVGFLYLKETGKATVELYVMGVPQRQKSGKRSWILLYAGKNGTDGKI